MRYSLMIALEPNAFDLYLKLREQVDSDRDRKKFVALDEKVKTQLDALTSATENPRVTKFLKDDAQVPRPDCHASVVR